MNKASEARFVLIYRGRRRIGEAHEIEAQRAQASPRVLVVGLAVGPRFLHAVEIKPASARKRGLLDELQNRRAALLDGANRLDAAQANHRRVHKGGGMQTIDREILSCELLGEIEGEQDLRQLALAIGAHAAIAARQHHVGKVDRLLARRRNVDDARGFLARQHRQQQPCQQEAREIIDCEAQFEAVGAEFALGATGADPGIVDERVEAVAIAPHRIGERANLGQRGEVSGQEARLASLLRDALNHRLAAGPIAAVDDDAPALRGQALSDIAADAIGRAGNESRLTLRGHGHWYAIEYEQQGRRASRLSWPDIAPMSLECSYQPTAFDGIKKRTRRTGERSLR